MIQSFYVSLVRSGCLLMICLVAAGCRATGGGLGIANQPLAIAAGAEWPLEAGNLSRNRYSLSELAPPLQLFSRYSVEAETPYVSPVARQVSVLAYDPAVPIRAPPVFL